MFSLSKASLYRNTNHSTKLLVIENCHSQVWFSGKWQTTVKSFESTIHLGKYSVILRVQKQIEEDLTVLIIIIFILKTLGNLSRFPKYQNYASICSFSFMVSYWWWLFEILSWKFELNLKNRTFVQMHCILYHKLIGQRKSSQNKYALTSAFFFSSFCLASCKFLWGKKKLCYHKHNV